MKIMHICNDYSYSKVYMNLYARLDNLGVEQIVYHPLRSNENIGKNDVNFQNGESKIYYSNFLIKFYHRILFKQKVNSLYKDILRIPNLGSIDILYPTTLFSDGALALKLYMDFNIPYIVAVRNTDVNLFLKYRPDLISLAFRILKNASKIIFISEGLKDKFYSHFFLKNKKQLFLSKTIVISNGIDDFWLKNNVFKQKFKPKNLEFLFIGRFDTNKNVLIVIKALELLRVEYPSIKLNLVGGGGDKNQEVLRVIEGNRDWIQFQGFVSDKNSLLEIYRQNSYFLMPSIYETFGLVFIEALSQGLPVLYTKGQGIDGLFDENVGEGVSPELESVKNGILNLIKRPMFNFSDINFERYDWSVIANRYELLIKNILP